MLKVHATSIWNYAPKPTLNLGEKQLDFEIVMGLAQWAKIFCGLKPFGGGEAPRLNLCALNIGAQKSLIMTIIVCALRIGL